MNVRNTQYEIVKHVAKHIMKWRISYADEDEEWDVLWLDGWILPERFAKMKPYQKVNHFPEMYGITRKNHLAKNLKRMQRIFPKAYSFFPPSWILPAEFSDFRIQFTQKLNKTFIIKPPD